MECNDNYNGEFLGFVVDGFWGYCSFFLWCRYKGSGVEE